MSLITSEQWAGFERDGYIRLGRVLSDNELDALQTRIDEIMLGDAQVPYGQLLMQLDSPTGKYSDAPSQSLGWKGRSLAYRKIQNLELDPLFHEFMKRPTFQEICHWVYGAATPISCFRAMFMNKPANQGTELPWHQDAWVDLDRQPIVTVWTALDPATIANGCVKVVPGTQKFGRINPEHESGFLSDEQAEALCRPENVVYLELAPGEAVVLHNWLVHSSEVNLTEVPRRGFSACYMDGDTVSRSGSSFTPLF